MKNYLDIVYVLTEHWRGNEDFEEAADVILSSYSSRSSRVTPPYEFHDTKVEEQVRMLVKAFKRNYEEFVDIIRDMDLDKRELAKLTNQKNNLSTSKVEQLDYHIRTTLLAKVKQQQETLSRYRWMSEYLEESAEPLQKIAREYKGNAKVVEVPPGPPVLYQTPFSPRLRDAI